METREGYGPAVYVLHMVPIQHPPKSFLAFAKLAADTCIVIFASSGHDERGNRESSGRASPDEAEGQMNHLLIELSNANCMQQIAETSFRGERKA
jgi:hypothetical protein